MNRRMTTVAGAVLLLAMAPSVRAQDAEGPDRSGWSAVMLSQTEEIAALATGIAVGPESIVAVGQRACERKKNDLGRCWGQPWISTDGITWEAIEARTSGLDLGDYIYSVSGPEVGLQGVAYGPGGFVAFGQADPRPESRAKRESRGIVPMLWHSDDGRSWQRVPRPDSFTPGGMMLSGPWLHSIAGSEDGYLLGGTVYGTPAPRAAIWSSPEGLTWTLVGPDETFDVGAYIDTMEVPVAGGISAIAVAPQNEGGVSAIAVGAACPPANKGAGPKGGAWRKTFDWTTGDCWAQSWRSGDGPTWAVSRFTDTSGSMIEAYGATAVAAAGDHIVVGTYPPAVLYSQDGTTWAAAKAAKVGRQLALAADESGFHALAPKCLATKCRKKTLSLWSSVDGAAWTLEPSQPTMPTGAEDFIEVDMAAFGDRMVVTAGYWTSPQSDLASMALLSPSLAVLSVPEPMTSATAEASAAMDPS